MTKMGTEKVSKLNKPQKPKALFGRRHIQYGLMLGSTVLAYGMRTTLNVAIVAMIDDEKEGDYPTYPEWKPKKNIILSSFFWGYICLQIGAGQLAEKYGPKRFLLTAILLASLFTLLIPLFGQWFGYGGIIASRIIQGFCQGFLLPSIHTLISLWTHISERARWGGIIYAGQALGNVVAMPITGAICASKVGWPSVFYLYGGLGITWCIFWFLFGSDSPTKHKSISQEERAWLEGEDKREVVEDKKLVTPWRAIFTSLPFIAVILSHMGQNWGFWTLLTEIPSYMNNILKYDIAKNSNFTALPYLMTFLLNLVMSPIADYIIDKEIVSLIVSRKIFNTIGFFIPGIALLVLGWSGSDNYVNDKFTIAILIIAVGFNAGQYSGFNLSHIDLSPVHAGTLMAITNSLATVSSILAPLAVDLLSSVSGFGEHDEKLWNLVFFLAAAIYILAGGVFILFGSGEIQEWNYAGTSRDVEQAPTPRTTKVLRKISTSLAT